MFTKAGKELAEKAAYSMVQDMTRFNFHEIGCKRQVNCYIGGLIGRKDTEKIRNMIDHSIDTIFEAKRKGPNSVETVMFG